MGLSVRGASELRTQPLPASSTRALALNVDDYINIDSIGLRVEHLQIGVMALAV
jgi:hypothetical protein